LAAPAKDLGRPRDTAAQNPIRARETVTVYCKVHQSWLDLQKQRQHVVHENGQTGVREVKMSYREGPVVRIRGLAYPVGQTPPGFGPRPIIVNGYAVTTGVDKVWWDEWVESVGKHWPPYVSGLLFAESNRADALAITKEHEHLSVPFAPLIPTVDGEEPKDARVPRSANVDMGNLTVEDERARAMRSGRIGESIESE
jgi:hypothetical protein